MIQLHISYFTDSMLKSGLSVTVRMNEVTNQIEAYCPLCSVEVIKEDNRIDLVKKIQALSKPVIPPTMKQLSKEATQLKIKPKKVTIENTEWRSLPHICFKYRVVGGYIECKYHKNVTCSIEIAKITYIKQLSEAEFNAYMNKFVSKQRVPSFKRFFEILKMGLIELEL